MAEKRDIVRARKRVMVRYGIHKADKTAFSKNVSRTGIYIQTNSVFKPGSTLQVELTFPDRTFSLWARVVWAKKVPPQLTRALDCGMGVTFVEPPAEWHEFWDATFGSKTR